MKRFVAGLAFFAALAVPLGAQNPTGATVWNEIYRIYPSISNGNDEVAAVKRIFATWKHLDLAEVVRAAETKDAKGFLRLIELWNQEALQLYRQALNLEDRNPQSAIELHKRVILEYPESREPTDIEMIMLRDEAETRIRCIENLNSRTDKSWIVEDKNRLINLLIAALISKDMTALERYAYPGCFEYGYLGVGDTQPWMGLFRDIEPWLERDLQSSEVRTLGVSETDAREVEINWESRAATGVDFLRVELKTANWKGEQWESPQTPYTVMFFVIRRDGRGWRWDTVEVGDLSDIQ